MVAAGRVLFGLVALDAAAGRGDRGDGEVAIGDGRAHAFGQRDGRNLDRIAHLRPGQIDGEEFGDRVGRRQHLDLVAHDVEHPAQFDAGTDVLVLEVHRDLDGHLGLVGDAQEIDMQDEVLDGIELVVLGQHLVLVARDLDLADMGHEPAALDHHPDVLARQRDRQWGFVVAVDDGGNVALAPNGPGGPLTDPVARLGREHVAFAHGMSFRGQ